MQRVIDLQRDKQALLQEKFWQLLRWEKVKRRERILISALFYSVLVALIALPAGELFPPWAEPISLIPPLFLVMTWRFLSGDPGGAGRLCVLSLWWTKPSGFRRGRSRLGK